MIYLFSKKGTKLLQALHTKKTLYAFDFDGTLTPVVPSPDDAFMSLQSAKLLDDFSKKFPTAIVSGRSIKDLKSRVTGKKLKWVGNHGIEIEDLVSIRKDLKEAEKTCEVWLEDLCLILKMKKLGSIIFIESKKYSITLHYRKAKKREAMRKYLAELLKSLTPQPRVISGKMVLNVIPKGFPHKGNALTRLMRHGGYKNALYVGDDVTDEDVFALKDAKILTIRVGKSQKSKARFYVKNQQEVNQLLRFFLKGQAGL